MQSRCNGNAHYRLMLAGLMLAFAAIGLPGCGTLTAKKFDPAVTPTWSSLEGVPFSLNRPKFMVTRTPGADGAPDTYAVTPNYEPDPNHQYVLAINPGFFSSVDWTMTFDANGVLTDTNAKTTDQTASLIQAIGSFAAIAAGPGKIGGSAMVSGGPAERSCDDAVSQATSNIQTHMTAQLRDEKKIWDAAAKDFVPIPVADVQLYLDAFDKLWMEIAKLDCFGQLDQFVYRDSRELQLLQTALQVEKGRIRLQSAKVLDRLTQKKDPKLSEEDGKNFDELVRMALRIKAALVAYDVNELETIKTAVLKDLRNLYAKVSANMDANLAGRFYVANEELAMILDALKAAKNSDEVKMLGQLAEPKPEDWRNRRVAILNKEIQQLQQRNRVAKPQAGTNSAIADDESADLLLAEKLQERSRILGVLSIYKRKKELEHLLLTQKDFARSKALIEEIDYFDKQIAAAEAPVNITKPAAKPDDPASAIYLVADHALKSDEIIARLNARAPAALKDRKIAYRPEYVIVFEPPQQKAAPMLGDKP